MVEVSIKIRIEAFPMNLRKVSISLSDCFERQDLNQECMLKILDSIKFSAKSLQSFFKTDVLIA